MVTEPDLVFERAALGQGFRLVAGVDEVGRGAWAGPVVAAAVILPLDLPELAAGLAGVRDSKQLSPQQRERLAPRIHQVALSVGVGEVPAAEIDRVGIVAATRKAMMAAIAALDIQPDYVLIDALRLPRLALPQAAIIKGDVKSLSIAAASIVAKVTRDLAMVRLDTEYPGYAFASHKGYGTARHQEALHRLGPCSIHRLSFAPFHHLPDLP